MKKKGGGDSRGQFSLIPWNLVGQAMRSIHKLRPPKGIVPVSLLPEDFEIEVEIIDGDWTIFSWKATFTRNFGFSRSYRYELTMSFEGRWEMLRLVEIRLGKPVKKPATRTEIVRGLALIRRGLRYFPSQIIVDGRPFSLAGFLRAWDSTSESECYSVANPPIIEAINGREAEDKMKREAKEEKRVGKVKPNGHSSSPLSPNLERLLRAFQKNREAREKETQTSVKL